MATARFHDKGQISMDGWTGFLLAGIALIGSPGPNTLSLAAAGAAYGSRRSLGFMAGLLSGMVIVMIVSATGMAALLLALPGATPAVGLAAAVYFAWLAVRIATAPPLDGLPRDARSPSFIAGVFQSLVNPKAYAAMAALFSGFVLVAERVAIDAVVKLAVLTPMIAMVNIAWLCSGAAMTRLFRNPRTNRLINVAFACLLVASLVPALLL